MALKKAFLLAQGLQWVGGEKGGEDTGARNREGDYLPQAFG